MELIIGPRTYSTWSLRGWLVMKRTGADFTTVDVRYETQAQKAALRQISPSGFVPVLKHGDTLI
ncbi:thioredoxin domain-containing protein [Brevundimonas aurantiaca]|uniref:glutathione S-transferase N-terminal domain-containing protein n=2 Tax=Caulobacteraceae TaxID=76892 RepID=UPI001CD23B66|nr:glutathione S-transferase N-terminal domain-containing protein [Brevundimonas aurantiaca]